MPKGVSIPPRLAEIFCNINRYAIYFSFLVTDKAKYPRGKKVISAISLAIIIEPKKVMVISIKKSVRKLPVIKTKRLAKMVKNLMFLKAQITASVKNKQASVFQSKYVRYCKSGGTIIEVAIAANAAIQKTVCFFINFISFIRYLLLVDHCFIRRD